MGRNAPEKRLSAMIGIVLCSLLLSSTTEARVTFTHSEVLQQSDLDPIAKRAAFKCDNGCSAYSDSRSQGLAITQYDTEKKFYTPIVNFSAMGGGVPQMPDPYKLKAGNNYFIENQGDVNPIFVFYVVDDKGDNANTPVMVIDDDWGIDGNGEGRMFTILSSKFDSVLYDQFDGGFKKDYPRIYSTGFDAVAEQVCKPLYQSRSQESASLAAITVFSPISTVDYGETGKHNVHVKWHKDGSVARDPRSSSVYSSPGYVGCSYTSGQSYSSSRSKVDDAFSLFANSLDINAIYDKVSKEETVLLQVDEVTLDFYGTDTLNRRFAFDEAPFQLVVAVQWQRKTTAASWAVQLDFATTGPVVETSTGLDHETTSSTLHTGTSTSSTTTSTSQVLTTPKIATTTSSGNSLNLFASIAIAMLTFLF